MPKSSSTSLKEQAQAHFQRALEMRRLQRHDEAIESYDHVIRLQPSFAKAHSNRGNALLDLNRFEEAVASYDRAVTLAPGYAMGHYNRAVALQKLNRLDEALVSYELAIAHDTQYVMAYCNRGNVLLEFNRVTDAIVSYDRAVAIDPSYADAYWNKSLALLLSGEFVAGWQIYEWRWKSVFKTAHRTFEQPLWNGTQDLSGKIILLHAEQGLGDTIHFCRYVQLVKVLGAFVVLEVPDSLRALFLGLSGVDTLIVRGDPLPKFDLHCPLLSLPLAFKTDLTTIPSPAAYLHSTPEARGRWQARLGPKTCPRIGLVWSGNSQNKNDHKRSLPLAKLCQYLPKGFEYVALQKEVREADQVTLQQSGIHHFGDQLVDFVDTAALCDLMDLVISVDTSVAHLAGAMGRPTWILLPFAPDWRWLLDRDDSPWYGSVKLYRQGSDREWTQVLARVASDLGKMMGEQAQVHFERAKTLRQQRRDEEALTSYNLAIELNPNFVAAHTNRGNVFLSLKRFEDAIASYDSAIAIDPSNNLAHFNRGTVLIALKRFEDAVISFDSCISLKPDYADAYNNRANALKELGRSEEALVSYAKALTIKPDGAEAYYNRALLLIALKRFEEAIISFDAHIRLTPDYADSHINRGNALKQLGKLEDALLSYDRAIAIDANYSAVYLNKSLVLLLMGDFAAGWPMYEWRWKSKMKSEYRPFAQPMWTGSDELAGKVILLYAEQGLGDTIQFCRYVQLVKALGAVVILEVPESLKALFLGLSGVDTLIARGDPLPKFDLHCPLLSLPLAFETDLTTIPSPAAYLHSTPEARARWQTRLGPKTRPRIGLAWSGSMTHINDHNRSLMLQELLPYLPEACEYVCLQKEVREADQEVLQQSGIHYFGDQLVDFVDTAALCDLMDLVISVDTSVAHLAGALGKPTWILLPFAPDWRWLLDRDDSPWYGSVKLYRQSSDRDWTSVLEEVSADLLAFE